MNDEQLDTKYASAPRLTNEKVIDQIDDIKKTEVLNKFLSKIPAVFLVVNKLS